MAVQFREFQAKWSPVALPPPDSFKGQSVLVTGATSGLGLDAAIHFANLGAAKVIITGRNATKAEAAKKKIEAAVQSAGRKDATIEVMELDLGSYDSCVSFAQDLERRPESGKGGIDVVLFNAGTFQPSFLKSKYGWEEAIQINTVSTVLLGLLVLPWLKRERANRQSPAHLVFVSSGRHTAPDISKWPALAKGEGLISHFSKPENFPGGLGGLYPTSKLLLMYGLEEVSKLALGSDGKPQVIVCSVCPGLCNTDIAHHVTEQSTLARITFPILMNLVAKSSSSGARYLVNAATVGPEKHGQFLRHYMTDEEYKVNSAANLASPAAREVQPLVWKEIVASYKPYNLPISL